MASGRFFERIQELKTSDSDVVAETGATLGVWISDDLRTQLEALASDLGISRSAMARELLTIAIEEAREEIELRGGYAQLTLLMPNTAMTRPPAGRVIKARRSPGTVPKPRRKAAKGRSRAKGK